MNRRTSLVKAHIDAWIDRNQFVMPDLQDSVSFLVTEASEALDAVLRQKDYVRNNGREVDLGKELADIAMMLEITATIAGVDLDEVLAAKLQEMDKKRQVD